MSAGSQQIQVAHGSAANTASLYARHLIKVTNQEEYVNVKFQ